MLPAEAAQQVDAILVRAFRDSERQRHEEVAALGLEAEQHRMFGSGSHRHQLQEAFRRDLERRAHAIENALRRVLELGLVGNTDAVGETLCAAFRERFDREARQVATGLPETQTLQGLSLGEAPQTLSSAISGELQLSAEEYVRKVRPHLPVLDLLPEQEQLLVVLVEASRSVPPEEKKAFLLSHSHNRPIGTLLHPGMEGKADGAYLGDVQELADKDLLRLRSTDRGEPVFDVRPEGFRYYEELRRRQGAGFERVERITRTTLDSARFRKLYPEAFECWSQAEALLWRPDVEANLTTVGHTLREGIQQFATALVNRFCPPDVKENPASDQARVKAVLAQQKNRLGTTTGKALGAQWATASDLVQRLEHGAQREREALTWEDARRAVFLVACAMVEVDIAVASARPCGSSHQ